MTLVIDNRQNVNGPGLHAFIVGISDYAHLEVPGPNVDPAVGFGMTRLASPALSAFRMQEWLKKPPHGSTLAAPLKTCRLLLAPSNAERVVEPALAGSGVERPLRASFVRSAVEWRKDASVDPADQTLFYFAGHGIRTGPEESVLALEDFAIPNFPQIERCASVTNVRQGMAPAPSFPNIARTQFYFIDACRNLPEAVRKFVSLRAPDVFDVELNDHDGRATPTYFATVDGGFAIGRSGKTTVFCEALLDAFTRGAEVAEDFGQSTRWPVTSVTLKRALDRYLLRKFRGAAPEVDLRGMVREPALLYLDQPEVEIDIEVTPAGLAGQSEIALLDDSANPAFQAPLMQPTLTRLVNAGIYRLQVSAGVPPVEKHRSKPRNVNQVLPLPWRVNVA